MYTRPMATSILSYLDIFTMFSFEYYLLVYELKINV